MSKTTKIVDPILDAMPKAMKSPRNYYGSVGRQVSQLHGAFSGSIMPGVISTMELEARYKIFYDEEKGYAPCLWCGTKESRSWDHLNSIRKNNEWRGFWNSVENLVPSCSECNNARRNVPWEEWVPIHHNDRLKIIEKMLTDAGTTTRNLTEREFQTVREWREYADYQTLHANISKLLRQAQTLADRIREKIETLK